MSLNDTPSGNRVQIGIFGRRNVGKSSLINALTGQETALVSDVAGTTTDPVSKAMELLPLGPVVFIDTPGLDDDGELGRERVRRGLQILEKIDIALLVADNRTGLGDVERNMAEKFTARDIAYLTVYNKSDLAGGTISADENAICVSARTGMNIRELRERIARITTLTPPESPLVADLLKPGDVVVLVTPIDSAAPKGRLILPQQQVIREILDAGAHAFVTKEDGLLNVFKSLRSAPRLVVTDSQAFKQVACDTPEDIPLTSFSILFARRKGILKQAVDALSAFDSLEGGDCVLISEGCAHHRQCEDIGTVKLPRWISAYTGKNLRYEFTSGGAFPEDLGPYRLIVHCGACMLNERAMRHRLQTAMEQNVPMTNYGILIAQMNGILERSIAPVYDRM
jgi:[FeFe] hydrogenase H-cluster maturation GTPase HydF